MQKPRAQIKETVVDEAPEIWSGTSLGIAVSLLPPGDPVKVLCFVSLGCNDPQSQGASQVGN